jgi:preprotein translocase subunit SecY
LLELGRQGALSTELILVVLVATVFLMAFVVFMERAQRRLVVQYSGRQARSQMFGCHSALPLKFNTSGVTSPIFAASLLLLPATVAVFNSGQDNDWLSTITSSFGYGRVLFLIVYVALMALFAFLGATVASGANEIADNLKKRGGFIPGVAPGWRTAEYIRHVLSRISVVGALYLSAVCVLPEVLTFYAVPFFFGGTFVLIVAVGMLELLRTMGLALRQDAKG